MEERGRWGGGGEMEIEERGRQRREGERGRWRGEKKRRWRRAAGPQDSVSGTVLAAVSHVCTTVLRRWLQARMSRCSSCSRCMMAGLPPPPGPALCGSLVAGLAVFSFQS